MDDENKWALYFAGILALKFHPRNVLIPGQEFERSAVSHAGHIADLALEEHMKRWPTETGDT